MLPTSPPKSDESPHELTSAIDMDAPATSDDIQHMLEQFMKDMSAICRDFEKAISDLDHSLQRTDLRVDLLEITDTKQTNLQFEPMSWDSAANVFKIQLWMGKIDPLGTIFGSDVFQNQ
ncbi:hypothetical protein NDU88_006624 [Pleurodeles waltl]|uniref:Heat shock factor binding protein 1 n=1 Tax=Pleurodeles waltl TaxID=8319 RepID=A0AAV7PME2_PLEWA|nr:hypothetical protein NDU88_006624 [Pleurodeles waltl]